MSVKDLGRVRAGAQLRLGLTPPRSWGGKRAGAGRKPGARPRVQHRSRGRIRSAHPCHVTLRVRRGLPSLRGPRFVHAFESSLRRACDRGRFRVAHYALQSNHAHFVVEADDTSALARGMMALGARLARTAQRVFGVRGRILGDRYHLRRLATPREVRNAIAYVLLNVRKHLAQRGRLAAEMPLGPDPASSGRWFDGWLSIGPPKREVELSRAQDQAAQPTVAAARSWLLRTGWLRHGRVDPREIPGKHSHVERKPI